MNIADIANEVGTVYDRTLHTSLTLPYSGFDQIAIAQNDIATSAVINNAIDKLYANYIQLYRYSNVASNVIPISSIGFVGALPNDPPTYNVTTNTKYITSYITTPVYTVEPSSRTEIHTVTSYKTVTQDLTSFNLSSVTVYYENLFYYSGQLDNTKYWLPDQDAYITPGHPNPNESFYVDFGQPSKNKAVLAKDIASPFNDKKSVYKIVESTNVENHGIGQAVNNGILDVGNTYTFSIYAKAAERKLLWAAGGGNDYIIFDLVNGTASVTTPHTPTVAYTVYVGNGWYRCVYTKTVDNSADTVYPAVGFGPTISRPLDALQPYYRGDGQSGVYVYGPQLISGSQLYPYMETQDTIVGTLANSPVNQNYVQTFTESINWVVPAGVTSVSATIVGGGGGGGGGYWPTVQLNANGGGGGGSGGYSTGVFNVTPGSIILINVGSGGVGGSGGTQNNIAGGGAGGSSSFGSVLSVTGGAPGGAGSAGSVGNGGAGGLPGGNNGSVGAITYYGTKDFTSGAGGTSPYSNYGAGGRGSNNGSYDGAGMGIAGNNGAVILTYTQTTYIAPQVFPLAVTTTTQIANITEEATLIPIIDETTNTYVIYLSTVRYVTTAQIESASFNVYTPTTTLKWYTTSDFSSSSQFLPLATTQYANLDNIITTAGRINSSVSPNKYVVFASTGTDIIALTGDVDLNNVSVALSTNTVADFSEVYFAGIKKLVLDPNTNYLYALDRVSSLIHCFDATGFLTDDNILANKLVYIKSMGGVGDYDAAHLFNNPESLTIFNSNLYVLDSGNSCIKQYDTKLNWITTHRLFRDFSNNYPIDLTTNINGDIYVLTDTNKILQYKNNNFNAGIVNTLNTLSDNERYQSITTSIADQHIFYLTTNLNVYKKFFSSINDTIGKYLFYRFNVASEETIKCFTSFINSVDGSDTNLVFSTYNGSGKFGLYYDNINLDSVLVTKNFDVYPLSAIQTNADEYLQNWVFNKSISKLMINHTRFRNLVYSRFLYEPDSTGTVVYQGTRYMRPEELLSVTFDLYMENFIGCNEIFQNIIVNRSLKAIFDAQVSIFNMLQLDVQLHPDLNIPVYIN
jgi:hypothetical protein